MLSCARLERPRQTSSPPPQNESADAAAAAALAGLPPPKADADFWRAVQQFTLNNAHYYCETADVSRPFPRCGTPVQATACCSRTPALMRHLAPVPLMPVFSSPPHMSPSLPPL